MSRIAKFVLLFALLMGCGFATAEIAQAANIPAEVVSTKAFVRQDHANASKKVATLEEGDYIELTGEWKGSEAFPWYSVTVDGQAGWIYGQNVQRLDGAAPAPAAAEAPAKKAVPAPGIVKSDADYVTVVAKGEGTDRTQALRQAWIESVRLAVGAIISSKNELNDGELSESIIEHSRAVVESFDILDEEESGKRTRVTIQAKVKKEILTDATKTYLEAQTVKADKGGAVKAQMDDKAKDVTKEDKQKSGVALLKEVLESYGPEDFYSATLSPKIQYDKKNKKPYIQITQKFNQDLFWKEFIPRLHKALEGVAVKKEKKFYIDSVRKANQRLPKEGFLLQGGLYRNPNYLTYERMKEWLGEEMANKSWGEYSLPYDQLPYSWISAGDKQGKEYRQSVLYPQAILSGRRAAIVPNDNASFTVYTLPIGYKNLSWTDSFFDENVFEKFTDGQNIIPIWLDFAFKMCTPVTFVITYLDKSGEVVSIQAINTGPKFPVVYRSFAYSQDWMPEAIEYDKFFLIATGMAVAPGFVDRPGLLSVFLGTANYNKKYDAGWYVELDDDELQRVDSMKMEVAFGD